MAALWMAGAGTSLSQAQELRLIDTCIQLTALFAEFTERRALFLAEDGAVTLLELLQTCTSVKARTARPSILSWRVESFIKKPQGSSAKSIGTVGFTLWYLQSTACEQSGDMQVVLAALELVNALVAGGPRVLASLCLLGYVPAIAGFAGARHDRAMRLQAALFVQELTRTNLATVEMLLACRARFLFLLHLLLLRML